MPSQPVSGIAVIGTKSRNPSETIMPSAILTTTYRYKRPQRKQAKAAALKAPAIVGRDRKHEARSPTLAAATGQRGDDFPANAIVKPQAPRPLGSMERSIRLDITRTTTQTRGEGVLSHFVISRP
jgi:hypothetical protein